MEGELWNQDRFNAALKVYLDRLPQEKIPHALNKKAFFIALRAMQETPKFGPFKIAWELMRPVTARRKDGSSGSVPVGYVLAAKRASHAWVEASEKARSRKRKSATWQQKAWVKLIERKFSTMIGARKRALGFIRIGWLSAVKQLNPYVKDKGGAPGSDSSLRLRGSMKGSASPAKPGFNSQVMMVNTAQAVSDERYGLIRFGQPALQRAFDIETADITEYLQREALKELTDQFNASQG